MMTITLDETLITQFKDIAIQRHIPVERLISDVLRRYVEDHLDIIVTGQILVTIESGEEKVLSLEEAEKLSHELTL